MPSGGADTVPVDLTKIMMVRRQSPANAGRVATGRTSRAHIVPHPTDWLGLGDARKRWRWKGRGGSRREIGRMRRPMRNQTRDDVGAMLPEGVHLA